MPTLYIYLGIYFSFYSKDHEPVHVHVSYGDYESIFEIIRLSNGSIKIRERKGKRKPLPETQKAKAIKLIEAKKAEIILAWYDFFKGKTIRTQKITRL